MAIIIREEKVIDGKKYNVSIYRTKPGKLVTREEKKKAEEFDRSLTRNLKIIEEEMKKSGLLDLKGKKGKVHKLWYNVGKHLDFVMDTAIVAAEDRDYVWRAIYDHAGELTPGPLSKRAKRVPATSHFSYCHKLSRFPLIFVEMAGDWTSWCEFFDRKETKNDPRIIEWLGKRARESKVTGRQNWLRPLTKAIHGEFENKDTTVFSNVELFDILDKIMRNIKR